MKLLLTSLLLILSFSFMAQEAEVFDCVVTKVDSKTVTVTCDSNSWIRIDKKDWSHYSEWPENVVVGQLLKGTVDKKKLFYAVASCEERIAKARAAKAERQRDMQGIYDRPALNASWEPADCNRPPSKFIRELLEKFK